ncbi:hypothetical protein SPONN_1988 [uncultured Candidatus Thioglobus sp.]|nr:hypothetical protein SPONL_726 [uncultured Candidatus Thioglobus sp.]SMN00833.1 hypothetical protein SPONN_1988 [uncultured Candidatus Thioglobus sp.]
MEGIDYYPRKKKKIHKKSVFWIVLLIPILFIVYYFSNEQATEISSPNSIVISEGATEDEIISIPIKIEAGKVKFEEQGIFENLDAIIQK